MKNRLAAFYLFVLVLGGCVPIVSLHPLYTDKDITFEEKLLGTWVGDSNDTWRFSRIDPNKHSYQLLYKNKDGKGLFEAHLVQLENRLFLDLAPVTLCDPNDIDYEYNKFFFIPAHTFLKVDSLEPELKISPCLRDDLKKIIENDPNVIRHEVVENNILLSASTDELQKFVLKYADDKRLFPEENVITLVRPDESCDPNDKKIH